MSLRAFALLLSAGLLPACQHAAVSPPESMMIIAHRGASGAAPENTLAAIRAAVEQRANAIEVDLHQTRDGRIVLIHDATVNRTTDGKGRVRDYTLAELKRLDAGGWFAPEFADERIPTLEEALPAIPHETVLILEVKDGSDVYPGIERNIAEILAQRSHPDKVILKSFATEVLQAFGQVAPDYPRLYVFNAHIPALSLIADDGLRIGDAFDQDTEWVQKHSTFITRRFVERAHEKGVKVVAWNVHDENKMRDMIALGVDGIETNHPAVLKELLEATNPSTLADKH